MANLDRIIISRIIVSAGSGTGAGGLHGSVKNLAAVAANTTTIGVSWLPPVTGLEPFTYDLRHRLTSGGTYSTFADVDSGYTLTGLNPGTAYDIEVRATGTSGGAGPWTRVVEATEAIGTDTKYIFLRDGTRLVDRAGNPITHR